MVSPEYWVGSNRNIGSEAVTSVYCLNTLDKYKYHYKHYEIFHSSAPFQGQDLTAYRWRGSTVPVV